MARKNNTEELIHCNVCGEDYSPTYRRCPFCGERMDNRPASDEEEDFDDGYVFDGQALFDDDLSDQPSANKGGKRLATSGSAPKKSAPKKSGERYDPPATMNWGRVITFGISLVIIIAALIIVFTVVYPKIHGGKDPNPNPTGSGTTNVDPNPSGSGSQDPSPSPSGSGSQEPTPPPEAPLNAMTLSTYDFTLWPGQTNTIKVTLDPLDWDGELTWTSSNTEYAKVDSNGTVTNLNETDKLRRVVITVSGGGITQECVVYCRGSGTNPDAGDVNTDEPVNTGTPGELAPGSTAYITGAASGLNVRSGPGTTYSILASLVNGNEVKILEDAGNGWYKISFIGSGGTSVAGYVKGDYVTGTKP